MRAARINDYGGEEVLKIVDDAPKPLVKAGQVLVQVHAAAVNPFDYKVREGRMKDALPLEFPATLGGDCAGVVAQVGEGVSGFVIGDEVYGQANAVGGEGSFAEFTAIKAASLAPKPASLDFVTAAAVPLAGCSAYQALVDHAQLQSGQKILVHGGAGGIGTYAIQLAKHLGAHVATTAAAEDVEYVKGLGADEAIDYKSQAFDTLLEGYDVVYDTVGGETNTQSYGVLRPGGVLVSMVAEPDNDLMERHNVTAIYQSTKVTTERLTKLAELIDQGVLTVNVDKVFPLEEAAQALAYLQEGRHKGKVVIGID